MTGRKALEINPYHPAVINLMAKVKADKEDVGARDAAQALSWNGLMDPGQEIVEVIWLVPQDRISVCVVEQTVDASVPQIREPVTQVITHERSQQRTAEQIADVPVPQILEEGIPQEQVQNHTVERIVAMFASQIQEKLVEMIQFARTYLRMHQ